MQAELQAALSAQPVAAYATLGSLLTRWARLEPDRCRCDPEGVSVCTESGRWQCVCTQRQGERDERRGLLQSALQDALAERGFDWTLSAQRGRFRAVVVGDRTCEVMTYSEVMSLLWAYLDALEPLAESLSA